MQERPVWLYGAGLVLLLLVAVALVQKTPLQQAIDGAVPREIASQISGQRDNAVKVAVASSTTKKPWLEQAVQAFNARSQSDSAFQVDGKPISVEVLLEESEPGKRDHYRSGTQVRDTLEGKIKPTVLSPADDSWLLKLNNDWKATHAGKELTTGEAPSVTRTPMVIAMWQSRARALGCWPDAGPDCTWARIRVLASSPDGWGMLGHPEWGKFKFGYGYVGESESGTMTALILCMTGAGKVGALTVEDVETNNGCGQSMADVEKAKVHSGTSSSWLLGELQTGGPEFLDAISTHEKEVIAFNQANGQKLREPLVAAYPQDGTVVAEHPFAILDGADWVSPDQAEAARMFQRFLLSTEQQQALASYGLRPADTRASLASPIDRTNGANPEANLAEVHVPERLVFDRVTEVWHRVKKHAVVALVFDKSGSMSGTKITAATKGAQEFVQRMDRDDQIMWMPFDATVYPSVKGKGSEVEEGLIQSIGSTTASGGTALYDAILRAHEQLESLRRNDPTGTRYGIVVLSDGQDTNSKASLSLLESRLKPQEGDPTGIQIHTIAIGNDADENVLKKIASAAHGRYWKGQSAQDMVVVYKAIATYY
jgi:Ca-activated chloride channel family protein